MKLIENISAKLPSNNLKIFIRRMFYNLVFLFPMKDDEYLLLGKIKARFKRFPFCRIEAYAFNQLLKGYTKYCDINKGDIVIDAGAIPGEFTIYASKKAGKEGKVLAFEPDENHFRMLVKNIKLNKLDNVIPLKLALWSEEKIINAPEGKFRAVTLDSLLKKMKIKKVDFIKMDIEGAEIEALKGAKQALKNSNAHLAIASYHIVDGKPTSKPIEDMLKKLGYNSWTDYPKHLTTYASRK